MLARRNEGTTPTRALKRPRNDGDGDNGRRVHGETDASTTASSEDGGGRTTRRPRRRPLNPYRVRIGRVVRLRHGAATASINELSSSTKLLPSVRRSGRDAWCAPAPGRDDGPALIGRFVRCAGALLSSETSTMPVACGEVVRLLGRCPVRGDLVEILIKSKDDQTAASSSSKNQRYEDIIRGPNVTAVRATLPPVTAGIIKRSLQWEILRRIDNDHEQSPTSPSSSALRVDPYKDSCDTAPRYVGDCHDDKNRQERNWRWCERRKERNDATYQVRNVLTSNLPPSSLSPSSSSSLATVTVERESDGKLCRVPIEHLLVVAKDASTNNRDDRNNCSDDSQLSPSSSCPLCFVGDDRLHDHDHDHDGNEKTTVCSRCRRTFHSRCAITHNDRLCFLCHYRAQPQSPEPPTKLIPRHTTSSSVANYLRNLCDTIENETEVSDFALPVDFIAEHRPPSSSQPFLATRTTASSSTATVPSRKRRSKTTKAKQPTNNKGETRKSKKQSNVRADAKIGSELDDDKDTQYDDCIDNDSCSRTVSYDRHRETTIEPSTTTGSPSLPDNRRGPLDCPRCAARFDADRPHRPDRRRADRRADRLHHQDHRGHRRYSNLAVRSRLRLDRSRVHGWGVFTDEDVPRGRPIAEYVGEIVGNAVADRRQRAYEAARRTRVGTGGGDDYLFRIDAFAVCDATREGGLARYVNASCRPNCASRIATVHGERRIVVYAKRNLKRGDELCYDYKFPLEREESRRIPCRCGSDDCRGWLNWDKKFDAVSTKSKFNKK